MLLQRDRSLLLLIDFQERLLPVIEEGEARVGRARLLLDVARILGVPVLASEQYPKGLGPTVAALRERLDASEIRDKLTFSCGRDEGLAAAVRDSGRDQLVIAGVETHVCVLQTALDFVGRGLGVFVVADATGSRDAERRRLGLERMRQEGVRILHSEMAAFEWLQQAGTDLFRRVAPLLR